ncbi:MAG: hypothetical protein ABMB14_36340, partial [Myxococcota bacterium]
TWDALATGLARELGTGASIANHELLIRDDVGTSTDHFWAYPVAIDTDTHEARTIFGGQQWDVLGPDEIWDGASLHSGWYRIYDYASWSIQ